MAGQTRQNFLAVVFNGHTFMAEVEEYTPPEVKKIMEETRGGKFIADEMMTGVDKLNFELKLAGATTAALAEYGVNSSDLVQVDVRASDQDADDNVFAVKYEHSAEITSIKEENRKQGQKPTVTITGSVKVYKKTTNGLTNYHINTKTQVIDLGQGDIMAEHRRNVGLA